MLGSTFIFDEELPQDTWWRGVTVCTDPFLDDYPLLEYALIYTGVVGILWVAIPRFANRRKSSEEE
jgi:hypothetical protein